MLCENTMSWHQNNNVELFLLLKHKFLVKFTYLKTLQLLSKFNPQYLSQTIRLLINPSG
ncbi:unnamed protein product [Paramecium octaurelia]|uniref:Uncharacterized protein n=1 Tax=Paramecium octaurelia TaxID=43137 RepID=A0A8S1VFW5_PAROT|nr:unnamed protein product [Paramecium octaurelia]